MSIQERWIRSDQRRAYDAVASEYYDPELHPTCANFRFASKIILQNWLPNGMRYDASLVDIGCGDSLLSEIFHERGLPLKSVVLIDASRGMLNHSLKWERQGASTSVAFADNTGLQDQSCKLVVASLGDPYNEPNFWLEVHRILTKHGTVLFTTPSFEWAQAFRRQLPSNFESVAEFQLKDGKHAWLPSYIWDERAQCQMIEDAGLRITDISSAPRSTVLGQTLSRKLLVNDSPNASVVTGYRATRG